MIRRWGKDTFNIAHKGFTIVELLIVIVVIAILAAITIVSFGGIQSRAHDAAIRSDFRNVFNKIEMYRISNGAYPSNPSSNPVANGSCNQTDGIIIRDLLNGLDLRVSTGSYDTDRANTNMLYMASNDGAKFVLMGYAKGGETYFITQDSQTPTVYVQPVDMVKRYPGGSPCGISDNVGVSSESTNSDFGFYYIYVDSGGGWRIWG